MNIDLVSKINEMQDILGHDHITEIKDNWKIFYELDCDTIMGFCFLYQYDRIPCNPDYNTGKIAEIGVFTFPKYRYRGVCHRLVSDAISYAKENKIDIVADCNSNSYSVLKSLEFNDSKDFRVWLKCSN